MDFVWSATLVAGKGLVGNANQRGRRQVTLLAAEGWRAVAEELGVVELDPRLRRANLFLSGVELAESRGRVLQIGRVRIAIGGETRPCRQMEEAWPGLQDALKPGWRGGVYGEVLDHGAVVVGSDARWVVAEPRSVPTSSGSDP